MRQRGFTYLTVLFVVAFMGIGLAMTGEVWRTTVLRAREADLLWVGNQYRIAIERYYKRGTMQYPRTLDDLLKDPRAPGTQRYLRKRYADPITGSEEWGLMKAPDGGIMGVYSRSAEKPFKAAGFRIVDKSFEQASAYSDWKFVYEPGVPGATQAVPQTADMQSQSPLPEGARPILEATQALRASMPPQPALPPPPPTPFMPGAPPPPETNGPLNLRHE